MYLDKRQIAQSTRKLIFKKVFQVSQSTLIFPTYSIDTDFEIYGTMYSTLSLPHELQYSTNMAIICR